MWVIVRALSCPPLTIGIRNTGNHLRRCPLEPRTLHGAVPTFLKETSTAIPHREAPEVVVEVISPSNRLKALQYGMSLFFERGAKEVWLCDKDGNMRFFNPQGELERSEMFGDVPEHLEI